MTTWSRGISVVKKTFHENNCGWLASLSISFAHFLFRLNSFKAQYSGQTVNCLRCRIFAICRSNLDKYHRPNEMFFCRKRFAVDLDMHGPTQSIILNCRRYVWIECCMDSWTVYAAFLVSIGLRML